MCNAPKDFFVPSFDVKRISRNKLHKYLIKDRPDGKILNEISTGPACIYQQTANGHSSLFLALARSKESVVRQLLEVYENDHKMLLATGYTNDVAVLVAFGSDEISFVERKIPKISTELDEDSTKNFMILMKPNNASTLRVEKISPKSDDEQKVFISIVERLHKNGTFDVNTFNSNRDTLFLVASSCGLIWALEKLLELGAQKTNINASLELACANNQLDTVKWFRKKFQPDLLKFMMEGSALFHLAASGAFETFDFIMSEIQKFDGDEHVMEIFSRRMENNGCNILMHAINLGQFEFAEKCLKFNPDLDMHDESNSNTLHMLLRSSPTSEKLCKTLIKMKPNLLVMEDSNQWTPLHMLATNNFLDEITKAYQHYPTYKNAFFRMFVDSPTVQKEKENIWCETPGHLAFREVVSGGHLTMAEFILENHPDEFESSAYISGLLVSLAQKPDSVEFVKRLQKLKHFDINVPDREKDFPLLAALRQKRFDLLQFFLESGTIKDVNSMVDWTKFNILNYAIWKKPVEVSGTPYAICCFPKEIDSSDDEQEAASPVAATPQVEFNLEQQKAENEAEGRKMFEIFLDLVQRGADVKCRGEQGMTLLHVAVDCDNIQVVGELLKLGLNVDDLSDDGNSPLHHVKSAEVFKALMEGNAKSELVNLKNVSGTTPFMNFVSLFGHDPVPKDLFAGFIAHKSDVKAADNEGYKPILAVSTEDWIRRLLENGADINATNNSGENAVHVALRTQKWKFAKFLLLQTEIDRFAVTNDGVSYLGYLHMSDVNCRNIFDGKLKSLFNELVEKFINGKTAYGGLVINAFVNEANFEVIQHPKADLHQTEADGQTCLHKAITFKSNLEVVKVLVDRGLDVNAVNESGFTPLMFCIDKDCTEVAVFLITLPNINLNLTNAYGFTALHYAARMENGKVLCKLLAAGADPKVVNNVNQTFYDLLNEFDKKLFSSYA